MTKFFKQIFEALISMPLHGQYTKAFHCGLKTVFIPDSLWSSKNWPQVARKREKLCGALG